MNCGIAGADCLLSGCPYEGTGCGPPDCNIFNPQNCDCLPDDQACSKCKLCKIATPHEPCGGSGLCDCGGSACHTPGRCHTLTRCMEGHPCGGHSYNCKPIPCFFSETSNCDTRQQLILAWGGQSWTIIECTDDRVGRWVYERLLC